MSMTKCYRYCKNEFYKVYFEKDKTINRALESLNTNEYKSIINSKNNGQKGN